MAPSEWLHTNILEGASRPAQAMGSHLHMEHPPPQDSVAGMGFRRQRFLLLTQGACCLSSTGLGSDKMVSVREGEEGSEKQSQLTAGQESESHRDR